MYMYTYCRLKIVIGVAWISPLYQLQIWLFPLLFRIGFLSKYGVEQPLLGQVMVGSWMNIVALYFLQNKGALALE
jgi:hypothetical protein